MIATRILLVALLQIGALGYVIYDRLNLIGTGREVVLEVRPVDPRDLFRGDYVVLAYDISRIEQRSDLPLPALRGGEDVWVTLRRAGEAWEAAAVAAAAPTPGDAIVMRGRVTYASLDSGPDCPDTACVRVLNIAYGIETYFVPQGEGRAIEDVRNDGRIAIVAAVAPDGETAIKAILLDGQRIYEEGLF